MFGKKDVVADLQKSSANIVSVFTKTVNDLTAVNEKIAAEKAAREELIAKAQEENKALELQAEENASVISKIQNFFAK
jgi:septal ring factor EnvC (AmiA/AmiB activator)